MIITKLIGGLGNQMFQYACGSSLADRFNAELKLDITGYETQVKLITPRQYELGEFNITENFATQEEIISKKLFKEKHFHFDSEVLNLPDETYLNGYWQCEKYFKNIEKALRKEFTLKFSPDAKNIAFLEQIKTVNSVGLHVRRGDYANNEKTNSFHGLCSLDYYKQAIDYISENTKNPHFFLFSDDIDWVKENLISNYPMTMVDCNNSLQGHFDLSLMKNCKHNIIANSSLSWWGAWLNENSNKIVIAPKKWFNDIEINTDDLIPDRWIRL